MTIHNGVLIPNDDILEKAIMGCDFDIKKASSVLDCPYHVLHSYLVKNPYLMKRVREAKACMVDLAEDNIYEHLQKGNLDASKFVLKTLGKNRGYTTGTEENDMVKAESYKEQSQEVLRILKEKRKKPPVIEAEVDE